MDYAVTTQIFNYLVNLIDTSFAPGDIPRYLAYIPIFLIGVISTLLLAPIIGKIALKNDITYKPKTQRRSKDFDNPEKALHEGVTPALGGLAVMIPAFIVILLCFKLTAFTIPILVALLILIVGSALDDIFNLDSKIQFGYQLLACLVIVISIIDLDQIGIISEDILNLSSYNIQFDIFNFPFSISLPGDIFLFAWLLLCINAVKWIGGSPGLIESYSVVNFLLLFVIGIRIGSEFTTTTSIVLAGSLLIFLIFAIPPQKIMSGSPGKSVFGFTIALLALLSDAKISTSIMILGLPLLDAVYVLTRRILVHKPKSFGELMKINDTTHFHHQLLKLELSRKQILLVESGIALIIGSIAIATTGAMRFFGLIFALTLIVILIVVINLKANKKELKKNEESPESKYSY